MDALVEVKQEFLDVGRVISELADENMRMQGMNPDAVEMSPRRAAADPSGEVAQPKAGQGSLACWGACRPCVVRGPGERGSARRE